MKLVSAGKTLLIAAGIFWGTAASALGEDGAVPPVDAPEAGQIIIQGEDKTLETRDALPGTLIMPEAPGQDSKRQKCMTVCARWGEDCMLVNKGGAGGRYGGGFEKRCRRTCKQFAEECF